MSESASSEPATGPVHTHDETVTTPVVSEREVERRPRGGRLNVVAAWVGIVAGTVFVVAVIFFSGFVLGSSMNGGHHHGGHHGDGGAQMERGDRGNRPGGPGGHEGPAGPGEFGPGFPGGQTGPGGQGPQASPGQGPSSVPAPAPGR